MPDYKDSKIYKITCNITGFTYYGSTTQRISKRMGQHRDNFKSNRGDCKANIVLESGDYDYCLVEKVECSDKSELHRRERFYIESNECVNKQIPGRTPKEYRADNRETLSKQSKEYRDVPGNKEKAAEYRKEYYSDNKDRLSKQHKEYNAAHREEISEYRKEHYLDNKKEIEATVKAKVTCECGCIVTKGNIAAHRKSQKHIDLMSKIEQSL